MAQKVLSPYVDVTVQPLYDTVTILAGGTTGPLTYFQVPLGAVGSSFTAAAGPKTLADTNMDLAGQLPAGQNFSILGFRLQPMFSLSGVDATFWSMGAWYIFTVGQKPYLRIPADLLPAGAGGLSGAQFAAMSRQAFDSWWIGGLL